MMDGEQKTLIMIVTLLVAMVVAMTAILSASYTERMKAYVANGYCETTVQGHTNTVMQKCQK